MDWHRRRLKSPPLARLGSPPRQGQPRDWTRSCPHGHRGDPAPAPNPGQNCLPCDRSFFFYGLTMRSLPFCVQCSNLIVAFVSAPRTSPLPCHPVRLFSISGPIWSGSVSTGPWFGPGIGGCKTEYPWMSNPNSHLNSFLLASFLLFLQYAMRHCPSRSFNSTK